MVQFAFSMYDPPKSFKDGSAFREENIRRSAPMATILTGPGIRSETCTLYGYIFLLAQNLEVELRECLISLEFALATRGLKKRFTGSPEKAKFDKLINMLGEQLDPSHQGSRDFIVQLHKARKLRNRLVHGFFTPDELQHFSTTGGVKKIYEKLKKCERVFFPTVMAVSIISRAYAADYGFTDQIVDRIQKARKTELAHIESDLQEIFDETPPESSE